MTRMVIVNEILTFAFAIALLYVLENYEAGGQPPTGHCISQTLHAQTKSRAAGNAIILPILLARSYIPLPPSRSCALLVNLPRHLPRIKVPVLRLLHPHLAELQGSYPVPFLVTIVTVPINIGTSAAFNTILSLALCISFLFSVISILQAHLLSQ